MNDIVRSELLRIAAENGGELRAADVVSDAEREDSPLHSHFEWADSVAAQNWRLQQARNLIRVTVEYVGAEPVMTRVFVSMTGDRTKAGGGYQVMATVMNDADKREQLLREALIELRRFEAKYKSLRELADVFAALHAVDVAA